MPNMRRLTWTGIAMHSGNLPGYPASHGCIRLLFDFSKLLFSATSKGGTVVAGDGKTPVPHLASSPGLMLAPKDFTSEMLRPLAKNDCDWQPEPVVRSRRNAALTIGQATCMISDEQHNQQMFKEPDSQLPAT